MMKGEGGQILYIGKANNLRQRVRQYFLPRGDGRAIIPYLVAKIKTIDTIVVTSEKEALLLENTLIKEHKPRYNVLLKDDKTYVALKINDNHPWPMVSLFRYKGSAKPGSTYFGPYTSAESARMTLDLLHKLFPLRQCSDQEIVRRTRPCILYDMKQCVAPCVNKCTKEEYDLLVKQTIKFLKGQNKEVLKDLYQEMDLASSQLNFERAQAILNTIHYIEKTLEGQHVVKPLGVDTDVLAIYRQGDVVVMAQLIYRGGRLIGSNDFHFKEAVEDDDELLERFLLQYYQEKIDLPHEILLPHPIAETDLQAISQLISKDKFTVNILYPQRGEKKALVEMAEANAEASFKKKVDEKLLREKTLLEMQERLSLSKYPRRIECFDNSNLAGTQMVSTLVSFYEGEKETSRYRKYKISAPYEGDDYGAMKEAIYRRFKRGIEENNTPDLLIIDGGKGHLNAAIKILADLNLTPLLDVIALCKEEGRHDKGSTSELIFLPNIKDPIMLKPNSSILFLLQRIRDEAHRTAILYNRNLRTKGQIKSALHDIPGIGPAKAKALLLHFGSVKKLLEATSEEMLEVKGISKANVEALLAYKNRVLGQP
jgi:excinuclease ABC subunit C